MNKYESLGNVITTILLLSLILVAFFPVAFSAYENSDIYDQWNTLQEFETSSTLRRFLLEKEWVSEKVSIDELDYILVLTQQCSKDFFHNVPTSLVLAMISVESGFRSDITGFSEDTGLMQVIPYYHKERIEKYRYDENVDLYDPRLNIMVGMDYLEELLAWSKDDISLALMAYNAGQKNARYWADHGQVSFYAEEVLRRASEIDLYLEGRM